VSDEGLFTSKWCVRNASKTKVGLIESISGEVVLYFVPFGDTSRKFVWAASSSEPAAFVHSVGESSLSRVEEFSVNGRGGTVLARVTVTAGQQLKRGSVMAEMRLYRGADALISGLIGFYVAQRLSKFGI
jgi:hypothetical protein